MYCREVAEWARQIIGDDVTSSEATTPVRIQFRTDQEWLQSIVDLGFRLEVSSYEELTDDLLQNYLSQKAEDSRDVVTLEELHKLVPDELRITMVDEDAGSRIESLFISYQCSLGRNGIQRITKENERVALTHVLFSIRPLSLHSRLQFSLSSSHHRLETDFRGIMAH